MSLTPPPVNRTLMRVEGTALVACCLNHLSTNLPPGISPPNRRAKKSSPTKTTSTPLPHPLSLPVVLFILYHQLSTQRRANILAFFKVGVKNIQIFFL